MFYGGGFGGGGGGGGEEMLSFAHLSGMLDILFLVWLISLELKASISLSL